MEFYQVINNRRTVRELKAEPVPADVLERIIAAGIQGRRQFVSCFVYHFLKLFCFGMVLH